MKGHIRRFRFRLRFTFELMIIMVTIEIRSTFELLLKLARKIVIPTAKFQFVMFTQYVGIFFEIWKKRIFKIQEKFQLRRKVRLGCHFSPISNITRATNFANCIESETFDKNVRVRSYRFFWKTISRVSEFSHSLIGKYF